MPRGTPDSGRPLRIALAALEVVAERGVEGLTHRAVAAAAGIPLGSTTYHFKTLDDLLAAAIVQAKKATDADLSHWASELRPEEDLVDALTRYITELLERSRDRIVIELELYMAALRRPQLLDLSREWDEALPDVLRQRVDPVTAQALAFACDGILLRAVIHDVPDRRMVEEVLRRTMR